jgi:hypothetical protein
MKKEDLKVKNIKSFSIEAALKDSSIKLSYDSSLGQPLWEDFLFDLLKHVKLPEWNKANVDEKSKSKEEWKIEIKSKDGGLISFYGVNSFPKEWEILMDLIETIEKKINEKNEENKS